MTNAQTNTCGLPHLVAKSHCYEHLLTQCSNTRLTPIVRKIFRRGVIDRYRRGVIDQFRQGVTLGVFFGSGKGASALTHENNGLGNSPLLVMARLNHQVGSGHSAKSAGGLLLLFLRLPVEERALAVRRKSYSNIWLKSGRGQCRGCY